MKCPNCGVRPIEVTLDGPLGVVSVCAGCAVDTGKAEWIQAVEDVHWLERFWKRDSSKVKGDGYVTA